MRDSPANWIPCAHTIQPVKCMKSPQFARALPLFLAFVVGILCSRHFSSSTSECLSTGHAVIARTTLPLRRPLNLSDWFSQCIPSAPGCDVAERLYRIQRERDQDLEHLSIVTVFRKFRRWAGVDWPYEAIAATTTTAFSRYLSEFSVLDSRHHPEGYLRNNGNFEQGDPIALHALIRHLKPKHVIEIGSGYSTRVGSWAVSLNSNDGHTGEYIAIEPFPLRLKGMTGEHVRLVQSHLENVSSSVFEVLGENDILFVDSSHYLLSSGNGVDGYGADATLDVAIEFTELIPRLPQGAVFHVHDIPVNSIKWFDEPRDGRGYNEQFVLQAFLTYNQDFSILWTGNALSVDWCSREPEMTGQRCSELRHLATASLNSKHMNWDTSVTPFHVGGSFYVKRMRPREQGDRYHATATRDLLLERTRWTGSRIHETTKQAISRACAAEHALQPISACESIPFLCRLRPVLTRCVYIDVPGNAKILDVECSTWTADEFLQLSLRTFTSLGEGTLIVFGGTRKAWKWDSVAIPFLTEVLPRLAPGVLVWLQDVPYPQPDLKHYSSASKHGHIPNTGQFLAQAFFLFNPLFDVIWGGQEGVLVLRRHCHATAAIHSKPTEATVFL